MIPKPIARSHWVGFLCLVPFLVMLCVHDALGLSYAMLVLPAPGEREAMLYNFIMLGVFWAGMLTFSIQAAYVADRGRGWFRLKVVFLAAYWGAVLWYLIRRDGG